MFPERGSPNVTKQAAFVSMDADGFTLAFSTAEASPSQMFSLALSGVNATVGAFDKPTAAAPLAQSVTGVGFPPRLVFLASAQEGPTMGVSQPHAALSTGASDGKNQACSALFDTDALSPSSATGADDAMRVFTKLGGLVGPTAQAAMSSLGSDGFSLAWTANDPSPTRICYWALGSPR
jgi:hypothetical protein